MKWKTNRFFGSLCMFILTVGLLLGLSLTASAADGTSGSCGTSATWSYDEETGTLTIRGTGDIANYSNNNPPWSSLRNSIKTIVVENGITHIGSRAFSGIQNTGIVTVSDSVQSIGDNAFLNCTGLSYVIYRGNQEKWSSVALGAGCDSLPVVFAEGDLSQTVLTSGTAGDLTWTLYADGSFVLEGRGDCPNYYYNSPWYSMRNAITSITVSDGVTSIGSCAFAGCKAMSAISLPGSIKTIGARAFEGSGLTEIVLPEGLVSVGDFAFSECYSLERASIPSSLYTIGEQLFRTYSAGNKLSFIQVDENNPYFCNDESGVLYDKEKKVLIYYPMARAAEAFSIPEGVTEIKSGAFVGCATLKELTIPSSMTKWSYAFPTRQITRVNISDLEAWCRIEMDRGIFSDSDYNSTLYLNGEPVTSLVIPSGITSIPDYAFYGCDSIAEVSIPESVTSIGKYAFSCCTSLTELTLPESVETVGNRAFAADTTYLSSLKRITFPATIKQFGDECLANQTKLQELVFSGNAPSLGSNVFWNLDKSAIRVVYTEGTTGWTSSAWSGFNRVPQHNWGEWVILSEPTEEESGLRRHTCSYCDLTDEEYFDYPSETQLPRLRVPQLGFDHVSVYGYTSAEKQVPVTVLSTTGEDVTDKVSIAITDSQGKPVGTDIMGLRYDPSDRIIHVGNCAYTGDYTVTVSPVEGQTRGSSRSAALHVDRDYGRHVSINISNQNEEFYFNAVYGSFEDTTVTLRLNDQFWDNYTDPVVLSLLRDNGNTLDFLDGGGHDDEVTGKYVVDPFSGAYGITVDYTTNTIHVAHNAAPGSYVIECTTLAEIERAKASGEMITNVLSVGRRMRVTRTTASFPVNFLNYDGSSLSARQYSYQAAVTPPADPVRPSDGANIYTFSGWSPAFSATCEGEATYTAQFTPSPLDRIEIKTPPFKTVYTAGDVFDPAGMTVEAVYENGQRETAAGYALSPDGALEETDTAVTVTYYGKTVQQFVTVEPLKAEITALSASGSEVTAVVACPFTDATLFCAAYSAEGRLAGYQSVPAVYDEVERVYHFDLDTSDYSYVKLFVVNEGMIPLGESVRADNVDAAP